MIVEGRKARLRGMAFVALATAVAVIVAVLASTSIGQQNAADIAAKLKKETAAKAVQVDHQTIARTVKGQIYACQRGNIVRALQIVDAGDFISHPVERRARAFKLLPILDCTATTRLGKPVALPVRQQLDYISRTIPPLPK